MNDKRELVNLNFVETSDQGNNETGKGLKSIGEPQKEKRLHQNKRGHCARTRHQSFSPSGDPKTQWIGEKVTEQFIELVSLLTK